MAIAKRFKISHDEVFPHGAFIVSPVTPVSDFERSTRENKVQQVDLDTGLPIWQVEWGQGAMGLAQPLVGLAGALLAFRRSSGMQRTRWATYLFLLSGATLCGICVLRSLTTASIIALPGTALLCQLAFRRAQKLSLMPLRAAATAGAL